MSTNYRGLTLSLSCLSKLSSTDELKQYRVIAVMNNLDSFTDVIEHTSNRNKSDTLFVYGKEKYKVAIKSIGSLGKSTTQLLFQEPKPQYRKIEIDLVALLKEDLDKYTHLYEYPGLVLDRIKVHKKTILKETNPIKGTLIVTKWNNKVYKVGVLGNTGDGEMEPLFPAPVNMSSLMYNNLPVSYNYTVFPSGQVSIAYLAPGTKLDEELSVLDWSMDEAEVWVLATMLEDFKLVVVASIKRKPDRVFTLDLWEGFYYVKSKGWHEHRKRMKPDTPECKNTVPVYLQDGFKDNFDMFFINSDPEERIATLIWCLKKENVKHLAPYAEDLAVLFNFAEKHRLDYIN